MPVALGPLALTIFQAGGPLWLSNALVGVGALGSVFGAVGQIALSFGLSFAANAIFRPKNAATKSDDVQQSLRVAISDRVKIYGQMQATGNWIFGDSKDGNLHKVMVVCEGLLVTALSWKIDDNVVTLDGSGNVLTNPYVGNAKIQYRRGLPTETAYSDLTAVFPEWTAAHRGDGVVTIYAYQDAVPAEKVTTLFPSLKDTLYRVEGRFTEIYNPTNGVTAWSDNAGGIIRDFMLSQDGMRLPAEIINTPLAIAAWQAAWNKAAEAVALKAGGTEPRYRLWGVYKFSETPGSVLEAMLANCDGRPILTRDGGVSIQITEYYEPTVLLDKSLITAVTSITRGVDVRSTANVITAKYISPDDDYQQVDADPWINEDSVSARGYIPDDTTYGWSPSHSQCRRLMKRRAFQLDPDWQLTVNCRLGAIAAFQERFVALDYTIGPMHIQGAFEVVKFAWNIGDKGILRSITISLRSIDPDAFTWDPEQEEGVAPVTEHTDTDNTIPNVSGFDATVGRRTISGTLVAYSILDFDASPSEALKPQLQGKKVADANWTDISVPDGALSVDGIIQDDGVQYEYQARYITLTGRQGPWTSPTIKLTATADTTAPAVPTSVTAAGGVGKATIGWTTPNSANFSRVHLYRNAVNNFGTATMIQTVYGSPNTAYSYVNNALAAGTYFYWVTAANASDVSSAQVATTPTSVVVT
ncbi:fibronectin type III domain-containing protein [Rhizobium rhizogenes]|uniref:fibronectin type III domain-containing protein n=1 Tax=Rhizobium rhizogenes TaxID=359 RepID=UPI0015747D31|nr:fibronectin type III domain-containing protein [Rhizobium rhizogenes]NTI22370.1 fibronectin type III domain-containing protein [Rhizobium rhizogenes]QTG05956.1 fibronectin type III domain-containing protein [Rhizobium rhizogenes]